MRVVAVFDTVQQRVDDGINLAPGAAGYTTMETFLAHEGGLDLVFNLTPAPLHRDITARALESGAHVYTEKPIASTVQQAIELQEIAHSAGRRLFCAPSTMVTARFTWLKQLLDGGELGEPWFARAAIGGMGPAGWSTYLGDPRVFYKQGVGPLVDLGVYMLHTITGLLGRAVSVHAVGGIVYPERPLLIERFAGESVRVETPDIFSINLELESNRYANLFASYATPATKSPWFELFAQDGAISVNGRQWYNGNGGTDVYRRSVSGIKQSGEWSDDTLPPEPRPQALGDILGAGILHAVECIENGTDPVISATHATHVLEIMIGALTSVETGQPVRMTTTF